MKTNKIAAIIEKLNEYKKFPTLEVADLIDEKVENDMEKIISKLDNFEKSLNAKYNVLLGMITFLGIVITVVSIIVGLKN